MRRNVNCRQCVGSLCNDPRVSKTFFIFNRECRLLSGEKCWYLDPLPKPPEPKRQGNYYLRVSSFVYTLEELREYRDKLTKEIKLMEFQELEGRLESWVGKTVSFISPQTGDSFTGKVLDVSGIFLKVECKNPANGNWFKYYANIEELTEVSPEGDS